VNICFEYLYRDGANYKNWGEVILKPTEGLDLIDADSQIRRALIDGEHFVAEQANIPTLYFLKWDQSIDHGWHEYSCVSWTAADTTITATIAELIEELVTSQNQYRSVTQIRINK